MKAYLLICFLLVLRINCQTLFWFDTNDIKNPDFSKDDVPDFFFTYESNTIQQYLSDTGSMVYIAGDQPTPDFGNNVILIDNETTFNQWTRVINPDVTFGGQYEVPEIKSGYYNRSFFPVDNMGFGNEGEEHNFKWCVRIRFDSLLNPGNIPTTLRVTHSDDIFIFAGGKLIFTYLGIGDEVEGYHQIENGSGGNVFSTTPIDIINCNRKRRDFHVFGVETNFEFQCDTIDECGVCNGDNTTCNCFEGINCNSEEFICLKRECVNNQCEESLFNCSETYGGNACISNICNLNEGCRSVTTDCDDNNHCTIDSCDANVGCINTLVDNCVDCGTDACISTYPCFISQCSPVTANKCEISTKNCSHPNPCIQGGCDSDNGDCIFFETGNCVQCGSLACVTTDPCLPSKCQFSDSGVPSCVEVPINCDHPNPCITGFCSLDGVCEFVEIQDCQRGSGSSEGSFVATSGVTISPLTSTTTSSTIASPTTTTTTATTTSLTTTQNPTSTTSGTTSQTVSSTTTSTISSTTFGGTISSTTSIYDPCSTKKCPKNQHCNNINGFAICSKTDCTSCDDLNCPSQGLKCISIKNEQFKNNNCHNCCEYIVSCSN
ncbi:hypothetical protein ACTFIW_002959 [Dictyostelium discoideum]